MTKIYCDGGLTEVCIVIDGKSLIQTVDAMGVTVTHNENEYRAVILALQVASQSGLKEVEIISDSQLVINQLTKKSNGQFLYNAKNIRMRNLRNTVLALADNFQSVKFAWVPRERNLAGIALEGTV